MAQITRGSPKSTRSRKKFRRRRRPSKKKSFLADIYITHGSKSGSRGRSRRRAKKSKRSPHLSHLSREQLRSPIASWPQAVPMTYGSQQLSALSGALDLVPVDVIQQRVSRLQRPMTTATVTDMRWVPRSTRSRQSRTRPRSHQYQRRTRAITPGPNQYRRTKVGRRD